jgi:hypothetical protein
VPQEDVGTFQDSPERIISRVIRLDFRGTLQPKLIGDLDLNQQVGSTIFVIDGANSMQELFRFQLFLVCLSASKFFQSFRSSNTEQFPRFFEVGKEVLGGYNTGRGRLEVFDALSRKTGAYVKPPSYNDKVRDYTNSLYIC